MNAALAKIRHEFLKAIAALLPILYSFINFFSNLRAVITTA
jgi:hypothetical protein